jgi:hypothetical protein
LLLPSLQVLGDVSLPGCAARDGALNDAADGSTAARRPDVARRGAGAVAA